MSKRELMEEYKIRLREKVFTSKDGELQLRYQDAVNVFQTLLDDLAYQEYLNQERRYDFWGNEIKHK